MAYRWSKSLVGIFHFIRVIFKRLFIIAVVMTFGTIMLYTQLFFNVVDRMTKIYRGNPSSFSIGLFVLVAIPLFSYIMEKSLNIYLQHK
jgi:hypothetical protein